MKEFKNARYIAPKAKIEMVYIPLFLYCCTYKCEVLPGIAVYPTIGQFVWM